MTKKDNVSWIHGQEEPWTKNDNKIWLASTVSLYRNIDKFPFPAKLNKTRRSQIISLASKSLLQSKLLNKPVLIKIEDMGPLEKEFFEEHFLTYHSIFPHHSKEAFIVDQGGKFLTSINLENHIQFEMIEIGSELEKAWNYLVNIENELGKVINYAFTPRFGFLTANPIHCGTGLLLSVFLQPSALLHTGKFDEVIKRLQPNNISISSLQGSQSNFTGDLVTARNNYTLGVTEERIISSIRNFTTKLLVEENSARSSLRQEENPEVMDKVSRAFGVLNHSYQIDASEALDAISLVKLGVDLGWIEGVTHAALNQLLFDCRRAHLLFKFTEEVPQEQIPHKRAEFIHKTLTDATLKI